MARSLCLIIFSGLILFGCSRQVSNSSRLSIRIPGSQGVGAMAALPVGRKACYGVSIRGPGIADQAAGTCRPSMGVVAGSVATGDVLQLSVQKGDAREIDVYLFLQQVGEDNPCPTMDAFFLPAKMESLYLIGHKVGVSIKNDVETINVETLFPGESQNLALQLSYSGSCIPTPAYNSASYQISTSAGSVTGAGIKLIGRVGRTTDATVLTGAGIKLRVK